MHEDDREDEGITEYDQFKKIERENVFKEGDLVFLVGTTQWAHKILPLRPRYLERAARR